jgi:hypothetical protein
MVRHSRPVFSVSHETDRTDRLATGTAATTPSTNQSYRDLVLAAWTTCSSGSPATQAQPLARDTDDEELDESILVIVRPRTFDGAG